MSDNHYGEATPDWFERQAREALAISVVPTITTSLDDPRWRTDEGRRARSMVQFGRLLNLAAALVMVTGVVAAVLEIRVGRGTGDIATVGGVIVTLGLCLATELIGSHHARRVRFGRYVALASVLLLVVQVPLLDVHPLYLSIFGSQVLVGPVGVRFILAVLLLAVSLSLSTATARTAQVAVVCAILAAGVALLEVVAFIFGAASISWFGNPVGMPPASTLAITLIAVAVLLIRPDRIPISTVIQAGFRLRSFWGTTVVLLVLLTLSAVLVRVLTSRGVSWPLAATYGWALVFIGAAIVVSLQAHSLAQAQLAQDAMTRQLRLLTQNSSDVVWLSDAKGRCVWVSPSLATNLGSSPAEWIGKRGESFVTASSVRAFAGGMSDASDVGCRCS